VPNVLRTGRPEFYAEVTGEMVEAAAIDEEHLRILREIGLTSLVIVPMITRGRTLVAITFVSAESGWRYERADLEPAEELARRAALAVDNARLYDEAQKKIAEREHAEEELRDSRDQLEIILRGVADGITAQDPSGRLIYANEAAGQDHRLPYGQRASGGISAGGDAQLRGRGRVRPAVPARRALGTEGVAG
jgi:PAS domain-containing protein